RREVGGPGNEVGADDGSRIREQVGSETVAGRRGSAGYEKETEENSRADGERQEARGPGAVAPPHRARAGSGEERGALSAASRRAGASRRGVGEAGPNVGRLQPVVHVLVFPAQPWLTHPITRRRSTCRRPPSP